MNRTMAGVGLVVGLVVVVAGFSLANRPANPVDPPGGTPAPGGVQVPPRTKAVVLDGPAKIVIECEKYARWENQAPNGKVVMVVKTAEMGEPITYLEIPDGWIKECNLEEVNEKNTGGALPGKAWYDFSVPRDGTYYLFLRAQWMDSCGDSVFLRVDQGPYEAIEDTEGRVSERVYQWAWHPLKFKGDLKPLPLGAGKHQLELATREDGPKFDKVLLSTDATPPGREVVEP